MTTEWLSAAIVAGELGLSERQAWELLKSLAVPCLGGNSMKLARFTRADYEAAVERSKAPPEPRANARAATSKGLRKPKAAPASSKVDLGDWRKVRRGNA